MTSSRIASAGESDRKSIGSQEFLSAEANDDQYFSPPAEPPIDAHYKKRMGSKPRNGSFGLNSKRGYNSFGSSNFVLTDNSQILKGINMNKMQH